jgi:hypothetical protein
MQQNPFQSDIQPAYDTPRAAVGSHPFAFYLASFFVVAGSILIIPFSKSLYVFGLFFSFVFSPLVLAMLPMWYWRNYKSQLTFLFASIAYAVWFLTVYFVVRNARDAMAVVLFAYVGPIASPILLLFCGLALAFHLWRVRDGSKLSN